MKTATFKTVLYLELKSHCVNITTFSATVANGAKKKKKEVVVIICCIDVAVVQGLLYTWQLTLLAGAMFPVQGSQSDQILNYFGHTPL